MKVVTPGPMLSAEELRRTFDGAFAMPSEARRQDLEPLLTLRIASAAYAVRVLDIAGFATARRIVPLGSPLPAMLGLAAVRGILFPVYSLEALLGDQTTSAPPRWFLLCGHQDPVALAFADFEGHALLSRSEWRATSGGEGRRKHVRELVRMADEMRGVIEVSSLLETIQERVSASRPIKER
jgi:chemotaxis signal transduction protein